MNKNAAKEFLDKTKANLMVGCLAVWALVTIPIDEYRSQKKSQK